MLLTFVTIEVLSCVIIDPSQVVEVVPTNIAFNLFVVMIKQEKRCYCQRLSSHNLSIMVSLNKYFPMMLDSRPSNVVYNRQC